MIAVTMGDGNGVGPEIILNAYRQNLLSGNYVIVGDASVLDFCNRRLNYGISIHPIKTVEEYLPDQLNVLDLDLLKESDLLPGTISAKVAAASRAYIVLAW
jgi:4-hydroxy-L-threonine phosphate dehydrogenase PdxA